MRRSPPSTPSDAGVDQNQPTLPAHRDGIAPDPLALPDPDTVGHLSQHGFILSVRHLGWSVRLVEAALGEERRVELETRRDQLKRGRLGTRGRSQARRGRRT
jgi:hypothetical protein